ncbi:propanediol utilization protein [Candidatus Woesearchaeota archaeon B3_Woes]|nr:MAG: propanediol utilization protein [Candidatus Woesearchaeota archaeon B3_Woes]
MTKKYIIPIEISSKHIHLSQKHLNKLFGKGYELTELRYLSQPGEFVAKETVELINEKNKIILKIVGPVRKKTQVELSFTDMIKLGLRDLQLRHSGDIIKSPELKIKGLKETIKIKEGVMIARRHLHCTPEDAKELGIKDKEEVSISIKGERPAIFKDISVRVSPKYKLAVHLDRDEGNAVWIDSVGEGRLVK